MKLVLLDRDGVLNYDRQDFVKHPNELQLIPGSAHACARLNRAGVKIALVSNQSVVGRGIVTSDMLGQIQERLRIELQREDAHLDLALVCPDAPWSATERRKPGPGMLREAMSHFRVPPSETVMVGDQVRDMAAGKKANVRRILVRTGKGAETLALGLPEDILPLEVYDDLAGAVDGLLAEK